MGALDFPCESTAIGADMPLKAAATLASRPSGAPAMRGATPIAWPSTPDATSPVARSPLAIVASLASSAPTPPTTSRCCASTASGSGLDATATWAAGPADAALAAGGNRATGRAAATAVDSFSSVAPPPSCRLLPEAVVDTPAKPAPGISAATASDGFAVELRSPVALWVPPMGRRIGVAPEVASCASGDVAARNAGACGEGCAEVPAMEALTGCGDVTVGDRTTVDCGGVAITRSSVPRGEAPSTAATCGAAEDLFAGSRRATRVPPGCKEAISKALGAVVSGGAVSVATWLALSTTCVAAETLASGASARAASAPGFTVDPMMAADESCEATGGSSETICRPQALCVPLALADSDQTGGDAENPSTSSHSAKSAALKASESKQATEAVISRSKRGCADFPRGVSG
mmetsp:Transcript_126002/g.364562  ORF Transcript_126002/g.364562 Transcript_126002/m.364562 type:complete len:407 (-) Transcript_126002:75-1295(-)